MSCTKKRLAWLAAIVLATTGGLVGIDSVSTVQPAQAALVAVEESGGAEASDYYKSPAASQPFVEVSADGRVVKKVYDLTNGIPAMAQRSGGGIPTGPVFCTKRPVTYNPPSCLERPEVTYRHVGCDEHNDYVLVITYENFNSKGAPVDTDGIFGGSPFTDTGVIPWATSSGPGVYILEWRLPGEDTSFRSGWSYQPALQIGAVELTASSLSC